MVDILLPVVANNQTNHTLLSLHSNKTNQPPVSQQQHITDRTPTYDRECGQYSRIAALNFCADASCRSDEQQLRHSFTMSGLLTNVSRSLQSLQDRNSLNPIFLHDNISASDLAVCPKLRDTSSEHDKRNEELPITATSIRCCQYHRGISRCASLNQSIHTMSSPTHTFRAIFLSPLDLCTLLYI